MNYREAHDGTAEMNPTRNHEVVGSIPGLAQWIKDHGVAVSCDVGCRHSLDLIPGLGTPYAVGWPEKKQ